MSAEGLRRTAATARAGLALLAAAGLTPCVLFYVATRRLAWACLLAASFTAVIAIPAFFAPKKGRGGGLRAFLGALYLAAGPWMALWSLLPDLEGYLRRALSFAGTMLFLLGLLILFYRQPERAEGPERYGEHAAGPAEDGGAEPPAGP